MPAPVAPTANPDEWQTLALAIARIIQRGPGSPHGRVDSVRTQLITVAEENYKAGESAGRDAAAKDLASWRDAALVMQEALLKLVPEKPEGRGAQELAGAIGVEVKRLHREIVTRDERIHALEQELAQARAHVQREQTTRIGQSGAPAAEDDTL